MYEFKLKLRKKIFKNNYYIAVKLIKFWMQFIIVLFSYSNEDIYC